MAKSIRKPRLETERDCDYSVMKRRGGIELVMECGHCNAEPGLENQRCFRNVLVAIQREGVPVAITMRSHVERRYGFEASASMGRISGVLNKMDSLRGQLGRDSRKGEMCAGCVRPLSGRLSVIDGRLRTMDLNSAVSSAWDLERGDFGSNRSSCGDCAGMTRVQMADIAKALRDLEKAVTRDVMDMVEAD